MRTEQEILALAEEARSSWDATSDQTSFAVLITLLWVLGSGTMPRVPPVGTTPIPRTTPPDR